MVHYILYVADAPASGLVVFGCGYVDSIGGFLCNSELIRCIGTCLFK